MTGDLSNAMVNGWVSLDDPRLGNLNRSDLANATKVVAHQIDDHVELRRILGRFQQLSPVRRTGPGSFDRSGDDCAASKVHVKEQLRAQRQHASVIRQFQIRCIPGSTELKRGSAQTAG